MAGVMQECDVICWHQGVHLKASVRQGDRWHKRQGSYRVMARTSGHTTSWRCWGHPRGGHSFAGKWCPGLLKRKGPRIRWPSTWQGLMSGRKTTVTLSSLFKYVNFSSGLKARPYTFAAWTWAKLPGTLGKRTILGQAQKTHIAMGDGLRVQDHSSTGFKSHRQSVGGN